MGTRFLKYRGKNRTFFSTSDGTEYVAVPNNNVCLVEVNVNHVAELLLKKCGCCDNQFVCFAPASEEEINKWKELV